MKHYCADFLRVVHPHMLTLHIVRTAQYVLCRSF